jgi:hypothetical protein
MATRRSRPAASLALGGLAADALGLRAVDSLGGMLLLVADGIGFAGLPHANLGGASQKLG